MKKRILMIALTLMLGLSVFSVNTTTALASQTGAAQNQNAETGDSVTYSLDEETFSELVDFVRKKWDAGELKTQEGIRAAIEEGEEKFDFDLAGDAEDMIVSVVEKLDNMGLDSDVIAEKAKELYKTYGDAIVENVETVLAEEMKEMGAAVGETIKEQVVQPAKEAASETAKAVVKNFWYDLKNSVMNFVKNIFHI